MFPALETPRLSLKVFTEADIPELVPLIGTRAVAATTLRIPHPYTEEHAHSYMARIQGENEPNFAIRLRDNGTLIGGIGLRLTPEYERAELGYWLGEPYWHNGYATEAGKAMLRFGFQQLNLRRIHAEHFSHNPASGNVLRKLGMRYEGCQRSHLKKWDQWLDSELYGILRSEWTPG